MTYFDGIVEPEFTLVDAIEAGRLTPYHYDVHTTELTRAERDEWDELSEQISVTYGRLQNDDDSSVRESEYLKRLLIKRADIVKQAKNKTELACEVIERNFESGDRWLIYCSNVNQLRSVVNRVKDLEATTLEYHAKMEGSRAQTLNYFEKKGGIIVSIKCLDEGVDIPNATHALILASSKNPREFVQRRGRVLRKSENKTFAHIHDAIVIPRGLQNDSDAPITSVLISELARAIQFAEGAVNAAMVAELKGLAIEAGVDPDDIAESGFESD
jgi:superfamily II DNA or RNA helicase